MAVNSSEECQNVNSIVTLHDEGAMNTKCEPQLELVSCSEVSNMIKTDIRSKGESNLLNKKKLKMDQADSYAPCGLDFDIEKGMTDAPKFIDDCVGNLKNEDSLATELLTEFISRTRGKFVQPLKNYRQEKVYDTPTNRSRKLNRFASFNSRRVLLLSSVLSIVGTMILIYLTLRVRPIGDASGSI